MVPSTSAADEAVSVARFAVRSGSAKGGPPEPSGPTVLQVRHGGSLDDAKRMQIVYSDLTYGVKLEKSRKEKRPAMTKTILHGLTGVIEPGRLTYVMGASGAGKTTLLNVLAGFSHGQACVGGTIAVNGKVVGSEAMRQISGFVHQEDVILDTMTVREVLLFVARLKLPASMPDKDKVARALDVAEVLLLRKSLDSIVGSSLIKGISGGEKRRLSLGMQMITNPSILYLDEPTSGLDAYTAYKVARILANLAHQHHRTIVCTIHQPSTDIFYAADELIVLAEGAVMYQGQVKGLVPYLAKLGYQCEMYSNPADFLFRRVLHDGEAAEEAADSKHGGDKTSSSGAGSSGSSHGSGHADAKASAAAAPAAGAAAPEGARPPSAAADAAAEQARANKRKQEVARIQGLIQQWQAGADNQAVLKMLRSNSVSHAGIHVDAVQHRAPFWLQFGLLAARAWFNAWRNTLILKGKLAQTLVLSLIVGLIFLQLSNDQGGVQDRQGSLFFLVVQGLFGSVMGVVTVFGGEKAVFQREYTSRMYSLPAYYLSRWLVQLPQHIAFPFLACLIMYWTIGYQDVAEKFWWFALIVILMDLTGAALGIFVSCLFNDIAVALSVLPMFLLPLMVFSGFFVNSKNLGWWFRWISYISPMKYGYVALIKNEFSGLTIECAPEEACPGPPPDTRPGEQVVSLMGFDGLGSISFNAGILMVLMAGFMIAGYLALWAAVRRLVK